ncbi:uncharacterized protein LOC121736616 isoform X2 [Aricia agestis]|uniref:uncharacterized protein LOC121736616 isoform X2 n=1 Tax=Aricia agestis TaxID=91739 RepID=UPI001C207A07|nr:uncharacterized protein LOC121736616 isoform X2 [Aricia agestis]
MAHKRNLVLAVVLNILIRTQCQSEIEYNDSQILAQEQENNEEYKTKPSIVAQFDTDTIVDYDYEHNTSLDNTEKNVDSTVTTEESVVEEHVEDYVDKEERVRTTAQYVTEASTGYMDNNVYNRDNAGREVYPSFTSNRQSDIYLTTTTQASLLAADFDEVRTLNEEQQDMGQRNPKTEADSKEQTDKWSLEKPRPTVALSRSSTLKSWLEDTWLRPPAGIMVPLRPSALSRALGVWNDLIDEGLNMTDIVIVGYDSNGVNWRSRHNLQPTHTGGGERTVSEALSKLLRKYQDVVTDASVDGTMRALTFAAKLVPYDSALFLITDKGAGDPQRLPLALRALIEKRLKVYTIWTDPSYPSAESEQALQDLKNVSSHTDGEVLPYSIQIMEEENADNFASEAELQQWVPLEVTQSRHARLQHHEVKFDTLLMKRAAGEAISLGLPVENGVTALRIYIEGNVEHAIIYPPNDEPQIDLNNVTSVLGFSSASTTISLQPREVHLVFPGSNDDKLSVLPATPSESDLSRMVGVWHLSVRCDTCEYRIQVTARTQIHFDVQLQHRETLQMRLTGPVASVRESSLVDETGMELAKLSFSYQPTDSDTGMANIMTEVSMPKVSSSKVYVKILGRDVKGESFVRLAGPLNPQTEIRLGRSATIRFPESDLEQAEQFDSWMYNRMQYNNSNVLPFGRASSQVLNQAGAILTSVQIGLSSKLYGIPDERLQLHFEVTNYRDQQQRFDFGAVGELRFLTGISPASQTIQSGQTVNVIVSLTIGTTAQPGARDLITFTAYGREQVSMSAYVYVMNSGEILRDVWAPEIRHNFGGSCMGRLGNDCAEHTWSATVVARDAVGGLLRLTSVPMGLIYDSNFISGSREEVIANYRSTCCSPRVVVNAVDAFGNTNSYVIDISNYITGAGIAAIVLAVILLIVIILSIIFCIYWCVKRRRESKELSSYGTSRNIS